MVLLVRGKDKRVQNLAAGNGGIVTQVGVDQACPVLQLRMGGHDKTHGFYAIEYATAITYDAIYQLAAFPDLRVGVAVTIDGEVLQFVGAFKISIGANGHVFDHLTILDHRTVAYHAIVTPFFIVLLFGKCLELLLQLVIVAVAGPQVGISGQHAIKRHHSPAAIFVAQLHPDAAVFIFPFF